MTMMESYPAGCLKGATNLKSVIGSKVPGSLNCTGPPRASATQTPQMAPLARDCKDGDMLMLMLVDILFLCRGDLSYLKMSSEVTQRGKEPWKVGNLQMESPGRSQGTQGTSITSKLKCDIASAKTNTSLGMICMEYGRLSLTLGTCVYSLIDSPHELIRLRLNILTAIGLQVEKCQAAMLSCDRVVAHARRI